MTGAVEPSGTLDVALHRAKELLQVDPRRSAEQALAILEAVPNHPLASLVLGVAYRSLGETAAALSVLERLVAAQSNSAAAHYELGIALASAAVPERALGALRRAVALSPAFADAWGAIGDLLMLRADSAGADAAYGQQIKAATQDPRLLAAAGALCVNQLAVAEDLLKKHLWRHPTDVAAIRMLAEVAGRLGRYQDAESLLARCLQLAPSFNAARHNYALALHRLHKSAAALRQIEILTAAEPQNYSYRNLKAVVLTKIGNYAESIETYAEVVKQLPRDAKIWMSYGHALGSAGKEAEAIAAYRRSILLTPGFGEAYWSLANLKTLRFSVGERDAMSMQIARTDLPDDDRLHFHFALGKACEDDAEYQRAFKHYLAGNQLRRSSITYSSDATTAAVARAKQLFSAAYFAARADHGSDAGDPIFVVGLPRSGSTLIEQILASHSMVEGTMELPDIMSIAEQLNSRQCAGAVPGYPAVLASLTAGECRDLGQQYLDQTRIQRRSSKPFFIDKMPNNFLHVGLIRQILPNAKIIDARRHPMACCFSGFKQHFARGQHFTYDLQEIGRYYRDYVELMSHFDTALPNSVHRVFYEKMIDDTEAEVRRLLAYCGLPFEPACLRFYENARAVRTASKQQVRQPIFREGLEHWRHFEEWLGPLAESLGAALDDYSAVLAIEHRPPLT